ncbi:MAG: hypothetical protein KC442_12320 [Thermomicrobiales bacterium]|nr:hypothetical protein [Thermomicrobiales bacterium]
MTLGKRIFMDINRPAPALVERFRQYGASDFGDVMYKANTMDRAIGPVFSPVPRIVGSAVTVSVPTGSMNVRMIAMNMTQPGDVLVINSYGCMNYAVLGGVFATALVQRGVQGVIIDGAIRDLTEIRDLGLPVFARGVTTMAPPHVGPGEANVPIACGRIVVNPGDIIVADEDGIVAIPQHAAEQVLAGAERRDRKLVPLIEQSQRGGVSTDIQGVEEELRADGFAFVASAQ